MDLFVGVLNLSIFFNIDDLAEKRALINRLREIASSRFNMSFAELKNQDMFTRVDLAFSSISTSKDLLNSGFDNLINVFKQIEELIVVKEQRNVITTNREG